MFSICCGCNPKIVSLIRVAVHPKVRHRRLIVPPGEVELPIRVGKEVLCLVDPFINEKDGWPPPLPLVLHKRIAIVVKALRFRIVIVVVVKLSFVSHFLDDSTAEGSGLVGRNFGIKSNADEAYLLHGVWFLWLQSRSLESGFIQAVVLASCVTDAEVRLK